LNLHLLAIALNLRYPGVFYLWALTARLFCKNNFTTTPPHAADNAFETIGVMADGTPVAKDFQPSSTMSSPTRKAHFDLEAEAGLSPNSPRGRPSEAQDL
jgi:hypothetical protein